MTPGVYYHGSQELYDFPSFDVIDQITEDQERAAKCVLGYYVTPDLKLAQSIGAYVYEVRMDSTALSEKLPLSEMARQHRRVAMMEFAQEIEFYQKQRQFYAARTDIVHIVEDDGVVGESFIVDLSAISSFTLITPKEK